MFHFSREHRETPFRAMSLHMTSFIEFRDSLFLSVRLKFTELSILQSIHGKDKSPQLIFIINFYIIMILIFRANESGKRVIHYGRFYGISN